AWWSSAHRWNRWKVYFLDKTKDSRRRFQSETLAWATLKQRNSMINRRLLIGGLCACCLSLVIVPLATGSNAFAASSAIAAIDKDNDGTLDLAEAKNAAGSVFDKLNW